MSVAAAGTAPAAAAAAQGAASLIRQGPVSAVDRKAAMAKGVSAAAAGSGAVASPTTKLAATAANAAVAAATEAAVQAVQDMQDKRGCAKKKAGVAVAIASAAAAKAAATAAVAAVQKSKVVSALPSLGDAGSAAKVWQYYTCGFNGGRPWEVLEREGPAWRQGERKLWFNLYTVIKEVQHKAGVWGVSHETAAGAVDKERPKDRTFCQWAREDLPKLQKQRGETPDASRQQAVLAAATAAAQAAQAAAAAATEALAAAAAKVQPAVTI
jgi:hypothetical protein